MMSFLSRKVAVAAIALAFILPAFSPALAQSTVTRAALGGEKLVFGGTIDAGALAEKKFVFTSSEKTPITWKKAFGIPWLTIDGMLMQLTVARGVFDIKLAGKVGGIFGGPHQIVAELDIAERKIRDFTLSLPKATLSLARLPGAAKLPGANLIRITAPTISKSAVGGKIKFKGDTVDAMAFHGDAKGSWLFGWRLEKPLSIGELINHKKGLLAKIGFPKSQLIVATTGYNLAYEDLPLAARNFYSEDGKLPDGNMEVAEGVNLIGTLTPAILPKNLQSALTKIGLTGTVELDGVIGGVFGKQSPSVALDAVLETHGKHAFPFLKSRSDAKAEFFIKLAEAEESLGIKTVVEMPAHNGHPSLEFDVAFAMEARETEVEITVSGGMVGDWRNAAGIKGLTLENPFMSVGINETGSFDMLIDGTIIVGAEKIRATADMVLSPEALGLPTAIAFAGTVNKIPFASLNAFGKKHSRMKGGGLKNVPAELRDLAFAFMTPGAKLPADLEAKLGIEGAGMAVDGKLYIHGKELAAAGGYFSTEGIKIDGKVSEIKIGPLDLKGEEISIQAGPAVDPEFAVKGDIALFKGFEEKFDLEIQPAHFLFHSDTKFGGAFEAELWAQSGGTDMSSRNDFDFKATLALKYTQIFKNLVHGELQALKKADKSMENAQKKLREDEAKVRSLKSQIARAKRDAQRAYDNARRKIDDAEHKVDKLQGTANSLNRQIHDLKRKASHDAKHLKFGRAAKEGTEIAEKGTELAGVETALKSARWALEAAKKTVHVTTVNANPKVVALTTALGTAEAGLKIVEGSIQAARATNTGFEKASEAVLKATSAFRINKLGAEGSLLGITSGGRHGKKPTLIIDCNIGRSHHVYRESITSVKKEFKHLAKDIAHEVAKELVTLFKKR